MSSQAARGIAADAEIRNPQLDIPMTEEEISTRGAGGIGIEHSSSVSNFQLRL
jgi:hypothetical protein